MAQPSGIRTRHPRPVAVFAARTASRARRSLVGLLMRLPGDSQATDPGALLRRFPEASLLPLRRHGLDPVPELAERRAAAPVSRLRMPLGLRGWLVTGHPETREVLAAPAQRFSNDFGHMVGKVGIAAEDDPGGLGFADPPGHTRLRRMLQPHFTARALTQQEPRVRRAVDDAIAAVAAAGAGGAVVDLQQLFALQIPSRVIMELLGIDDTDREEFHRLSSVRFDFADGATSSFDAIAQSISLLRTVVAKQRVEPGPGLIGAILREFGDDVDDVELAGLADGVLVGGLETTVSMLALGAVVLLRDRTAWDCLRERDDHVGTTVEELLRYLSVVQVGFPRFAAADAAVGDTFMLAGDAVFPSLVAANRDPRLTTADGATTVADLETFDHTRPPTAHVAFGHGLHRCVGAELARLELRIAYPALIRAFPDMRLAVPAEELRYRQVSIVHGLESLPVVLG
ncbi:Cytochrome P450 [Jatrophihabitans endophyticus]|uniref:Cytochrome P450 n=2 Tax=Jatrophihabitans endophyticus TaxID=1206085 RepID=A0A1M5KAM0_9ACTN|nr:cytochrome P450 [Jatrophihabitans endophyticus]SHG49778.1 Cytochrome P450 [Jatrophihabitans endophyticus]